jgi:hypothetical protein
VVFSCLQISSWTLLTTLNLLTCNNAHKTNALCSNPLSTTVQQQQQQSCMILNDLILIVGREKAFHSRCCWSRAAAWVNVWWSTRQSWIFNLKCREIICVSKEQQWGDWHWQGSY